MHALAGEMVGRLPKEAPTLPVPDILDLPSPQAEAGAAAAASAPLLSFDRFFSGTGTPPRARMDSPAAAVPALRAVAPPPIPSPSLSPTFGGVPVIPPGRPVTPATWAAFDRLASTPTAAATPIPAPTAVAGPVVPVSAFDVPAPLSARPLTPPSSAPSIPAAPVTEASSTPVSPPSAPSPTGDEPKRAPSDFHRWLEGLS
jgi:hypothetical protein